MENLSLTPFCGSEHIGENLSRLKELWGAPWKTDEQHDYTLCTWRQGEHGEYYIILMFDPDGGFFDLFDEGIYSECA